jgi:hypothetical protein
MKIVAPALVAQASTMMAVIVLMTAVVIEAP